MHLNQINLHNYLDLKLQGFNLETIKNFKVLINNKIIILLLKIHLFTKIVMVELKSWEFNKHNIKKLINNKIIIIIKLINNFLENIINHKILKIKQ